MDRKQTDCIVVLHNIRSVHNAGSIMRTADGAGASHVVFSGYTPGPVDHVGTNRPDFLKVSLGAERTISWSRTKTLGKVLERYAAEGWRICMLEQSSKSIPLFSFVPKGGEKIVLVLGNEVTGIPKSMLKRAGTILEIPMRGKKESLNVSVAAGIALYQLLR